MFHVETSREIINNEISTYISVPNDVLFVFTSACIFSFFPTYMLSSLRNKNHIFISTVIF